MSDGVRLLAMLGVYLCGVLAAYSHEFTSASFVCALVLAASGGYALMRSGR